ncbi:MAG: glycosyltransferase family 4 protein [Candidatus Berkelbacteria bacterium]|nr:MAG: glycosyltransferase family 4 protein [Candidatus Berkelbacteria bacterium]QQG51388.1 MAG: glycosyltransferase family 4 protein [Candidatus Berkelbacteria bacterium]
MTIGIDASRAVKQIRTGVEQYSWEVIQQLLRLDKTNKFILYAPHNPRDPFPLGSRAEWCIIKQRRLWSQIGLARELKKSPPDVLFVPSHVIPFASRVPAVVTIHDTAYKYFPGSYSYAERNYLNFTTAVSIRRAKRVIVPSTSTKRDVIKEYPESQNKIVVIPHGVDHVTFNPDIKADRPIKDPYVFFVGRIEDKKNVRLLVEAFALLAKERKNIRLVLAGSNGYGFERVQQTIRALPKPVRDLILQPGYIPRYDLTRYLKHAHAFAFPSIYEGFGMPMLEAMAIGTPVVCADGSSLPEVAGDAAVLLPPNNPLAWAAALSRIINQPKVADELRRKGFKQAAKFTWEKTGQETLDTIIDVAA